MRTLFVKVNDRYSGAYQLETALVEKDGQRRAIKRALLPEAKPHLAAMREGYEALKDRFERLTLCPVEETGDGTLSFAYIEGVSGQDHLEKILRAGDKTRFVSEFMRLLSLLPEADRAYTESEGFRERFGEGAAFAALPAYAECLFDFTPGNLILADDTPVFIDYEWYLRFPVPADLLRLHFAESFYLNTPDCEAYYPKAELIREMRLSLPDALALCRQHFLRQVMNDENTLNSINTRYRKRAFSPMGGADALLADREEAIRAKDQWIGEQQKLLEYKDALLAEKTKLAGQYEEVLGLRNAAIQEKDGWIAEQQKLLEYKDARIAEKDALTKQYAEVLSQRDEAITEKDAWIKEQQTLLEYKDAQITEKDDLTKQYAEVLSQRDEAITEKDAWIKEQQKLLEYKDALQAEREGLYEAQLEDKQNMLDGMDVKLARCQAELSALRQRIYRIENTKIWKCTKRFHKGI